MKAIKIMLRVLQGLAVAAMLLVASLSLYTIVRTTFFQDSAPSVLGYRQLVIVSGSMEPVIHPGDYVIVKAQADYAPGDIVTYLDGHTYVTHRIVSMEGDTVYLKGDNNNTQDQPIRLDQIVGSVVKVIPELGYLTLWLRSTPGVACMLAGLALILFGPGWVGGLRRRGEVRRQRAQRMAALARRKYGADGGEET